MDDLISRQAAVSRISDLLMLELKGQRLPTWDEVNEAINELPSAQQETHDKRTETHECDYISRQAAIDAIRKGKPKETEYRGSCADSCGIGKLLQYESDISAVIALPSAERKGKWMFSPDHAEGICTCCNYKIYGRPYQNTYLIVPYNYCPNCGAMMKGEEDVRESD